ncbi:hypothetical protein SprV_0501911200 [Sparganum proliferum]
MTIRQSHLPPLQRLHRHTCTNPYDDDDDRRRGRRGHRNYYYYYYYHTADAPPSPTTTISSIPATASETTATTATTSPAFTSTTTFTLTTNNGIDLVGHLRLHRGEAGDPVPGAPTYTCITGPNCLYCPHKFSPLVSLLGHMRIRANPLENTTGRVLSPNTFLPAHTPRENPSRPIHQGLVMDTSRVGCPRSNRPERRTVPVVRGLARYKVDIAALSETWSSEQGQLEEAGNSCTFF